MSHGSTRRPYADAAQRNKLTGDRRAGECPPAGVRLSVGLRRSTGRTLVKEQLPATIALRPDRTSQRVDNFVRCDILPSGTVGGEDYVLGERHDLEIGE